MYAQKQNVKPNMESNTIIYAVSASVICEKERMYWS